MKRNRKFTAVALGAALLSVIATSCGTPKNVAYVQDMDEAVQVEMRSRAQITVKPEDKLQIIVTSKDPALASLFNLPVVTSRLGQGTANFGKTSAGFSGNTESSEGLAAYTVSPEGNIEFPVLGTLHIAGMTRTEVAGFIKGELMGRNLIKDPTVIVEFLNTGISVLGEVNEPGRFVVNRDQLTILDAIAMAGDLDIQAQRENVKVIRIENGKSKAYTVDLTSGKDLFSSPVYYLQQDDIVYVEPNNYRKRQTTASGNSTLTPSFWMSVLSSLTSVAVLIVNIVR